MNSTVGIVTLKGDIDDSKILTVSKAQGDKFIIKDGEVIIVTVEAEDLKKYYDPADTTDFIDDSTE